MLTWANFFFQKFVSNLYLCALLGTQEAALNFKNVANLF